MSYSIVQTQIETLSISCISTLYMHCRYRILDHDVIYYLGNRFAVIEWEDEETASVVPCCHVGCGVFEVGMESNVWTQQGRYKGHVAACGKKTKYMY